MKLEYVFRAIQVSPGVENKLDWIRGRPYIWKGDAGTYRCIDRRSCLIMFPSWEQEVRRAISENAKPGGLFINVGANIGRLAVYASSLGMEVLALEPHKRAYWALVSNFNLNNIKGKTLNAAAWSHEAKLPFFKSSKNSMLSSLMERNPRDGVALEKVYDVDAIPIDSLNLDPAILQIDAEGAEVEILLGANRTLWQSKPTIIFETWEKEKFREIKRILQPMGYKITPLDGFNFKAGVL